MGAIRVGCTGWSIRAFHRDLFPRDGSHLERYAGRLACAEISSSFYRPHRRSTYERWAARVPAEFRFAVKAPRTITHERALAGARDDLTRFLDEVAGLGGKLGPLLFQTPSSVGFSASVVARFLALLRRHHDGLVAWEPRHPAWFTAEAARVLTDARVARVAADPPRSPRDGRPGAWRGLAYFRLHGWPVKFVSAYAPSRIPALATAIRSSARRGETWCIFDNTISGACNTDALALAEALGGGVAS